MLRGLIPGKWEAAFTGAPIWRIKMAKDVVNYKEFDCIDCHCHVYTWMDDPRDRCAVCTWIYMQPNLTKSEIAEIRLITATPILEKNDD
jgi:hypothetical protein